MKRHFSSTTLIISLLAMSLVLGSLSGCKDRAQESVVPLSPDHVNAVIDVADINFINGKYDEAKKDYESVKKSLEKDLRKEEPLYANIIAKLAASEEALGNLDKAEAQYIQSISLYNVDQVKNANDLSLVYSALGSLQLKENKLEQAEASLNTALSLSEKSNGKDSLDNIKHLEALAKLYEVTHSEKLKPLKVRLSSLQSLAEKADKSDKTTSQDFAKGNDGSPNAHKENGHTGDKP